MHHKEVAIKRNCSQIRCWQFSKSLFSIQCLE